VLEARLAKDDYLAGESGRAEITVRNEGKQPLFVGGPSLRLTDEQGKPAPPSYLQYPPAYDPPPPGERHIQPRGSFTSTIPFELPPAEQVAGHHYSLSLAADFSRAGLKKDRSDNISMDLGLGPLPLKVSTPGPGQYLKASLQADAGGYTLTLTNELGRRVVGPAWGASQISSPHVVAVGPMPNSPDGTWSGRWDPSLLESGRPLLFQAWVAAPGYVATSISKTVTISEGVEVLGWVEPGVANEQIQTFHSVEDARAALGDLPL
jgi:hypothetical protein